MYEEIIYDVDDSVAVITMNRSETLNALTDRTQAEIRHALEVSERDEIVIGNVLTGVGRGFCSGVDMNALGAMSEAGRRLGNARIRSSPPIRATPTATPISKSARRTSWGSASH